MLDEPVAEWQIAEVKPFSDDTDPEAHRRQVALLRELGPGQRLAMVARLNDAADTMALARLAAEYPDDTPRVRRLRDAGLADSAPESDPPRSRRKP